MEEMRALTIIIETVTHNRNAIRREENVFSVEYCYSRHHSIMYNERVACYMQEPLC